MTVLKPGKNGQNVDLVMPAPPSLTIALQARQDGKLIARYLRAGICREANTSRGIGTDCRISVVKNFPR